MDPRDYLVSLGGVARTSTLRAAGYSKREIAALARHAQKPKLGILVVSGCDPDFLFALLHDGLLTCGTAAKHYGLWIRRAPSKRHLACRHSRTSGFVAHRAVRLPGHPRLPIASLEDTLIHALACLDKAQSLSMLESALRKGIASPDRLVSLMTGPRNAPLRTLVAQATGLSQSQPEVEARLLFEARGWAVVVQAQIPGVGHVDFLIEGIVIVEVDGHEFHGDRPAFVEDRRRVNAALLLGYPTLRYPPEVVWNNPQRIIREVEELLVAWRLGQRKA